MLRIVAVLLVALPVVQAWSAPATAQKKQVIIFFRDQRDSNPADQERVRQYIIKQSGVDFNVRKAKTADEFTNQLTTALAAQEPIDMIGLVDVTLGELKQRGAVYKLTDVVKKYAPNLLKNVSAESWKIVTDQNGDIWAIPGDNFQYQGPALEIRADWRQKLGLGPIASVADFENYLRKVKDGDLDGNGKADTIPLLNTDQGYIAYDETLSYLFTGVNMDDNPDQWSNYLDASGRIVPVPMHPGFKDYLRKMAQWNKDGLIYPETLSIKDNEITDLIAAGRVGATSGWYSNTYRPWQTLLKTVPTAAYEIIQPKAFNGQPYKFKKSDPGSPQLSVVSYSPVAAEAVKLIDWLGTAKENYVTIKSGIQGQDWEWVDKSKNVIKFLVDKSNPSNTYNYAFSFWFQAPWNWRETNPSWLNATYYAGQDTINVAPGLHNPDWFVIYDFKGTPIENALADANTLLNEAIANIILGKRPVDDWDQVIAQFRRMVGDQYIVEATKQYRALSK
jgi:hypothetical protein